MNRRSVCKALAVSSMAMTLPSSLLASSTRDQMGFPQRGSFSLDGNKLRFSHPAIIQPFSVTMIADTHLFRDDDRGLPYIGYSKRMSKAYNQTKHFQTGKEINPEIGFEEALKVANEQKSSMIALVGDIFSYPSEAAIDWVQDKLKSSSIPYVYTSGNHDWHYEGMEGTADQLREEWIKKRLLPFYQDRDPMMQKIEMNGVNIIVLDNSTYEISPLQLQFLKKSLSDGKPAVLMVHIPLYAPGRSLGFGCGHPEWNAANDKNYVLERRVPWRKDGHTKATMEFYETVFLSKNLMGVLAGHIHNQSVDVVNGIPQVVTESNAEGGFLQVNFVPNLSA